MIAVSERHLSKAMELEDQVKYQLSEDSFNSRIIKYLLNCSQLETLRNLFSCFRFLKANESCLKKKDHSRK